MILGSLGLVECGGMDRWDVLIILAAGYVAIMALVRMMAGRRNQVVNHVREQIAEQRSKQKNKSNKQPADDADRGAA